MLGLRGWLLLVPLLVAGVSAASATCCHSRLAPRQQRAAISECVFLTLQRLSLDSISGASLSALLLLLLGSRC